MKKSHQQAFNKAYVSVLKSNDRKLLYNAKTKTHDVVVPLATVIKSFRVFIDKVEKDLKIGKYKAKAKSKTKK
jgi:hypothetical protein